MSTNEIIRIDGWQKYYGAKLVLDQITLSLNQGERAALVGENGAGKTTLARLMTGAEQADSGTLRVAAGAVVGFLPQEVAAPPQTSIAQYLAQAAGKLETLRTELAALETALAQPQSATDMTALLAHYGEIQTEFEKRGGYELETRLSSIFGGLSIAYLDTERDMATLSGGEKTRVALAALLLREPDLLILDEPTNHLDFAGIAWLEEYLTSYPHALLLITHDRRFINRVANCILELSPVTHGLKTYYGNYEDYLAQREAEYQQAVAAYTGQLDQMTTLKRQIKLATHNPRKVTIPSGMDGITLGKMKATSQNTVSKKVTDAKQRIADIQDNLPDNPRHTWTVRFTFAPLDLPSAEPLRFTNLSKGYADTVLFEQMSGVLRKGERAVLVAPNGTGKTTLLRILAGLTQPDAGSVTVSQSAVTGYLDQEGETLNQQQLVLESYREVQAGADRDLLAELHRSGLFTDASLPYKTVSDLSVGQRRKLALARIIASRANVLLLDEPTNHLDLLSLEALEAALRVFPGALLAVSHDRWFIERVATHIWHLEAGKLRVEQVQ